MSKAIWVYFRLTKVKKIQINNFGFGWHYKCSVEHRAVLKEQYNNTILILLSSLTSLGAFINIKKKKNTIKNIKT